jgi:MSHA pilin protein MshD
MHLIGRNLRSAARGLTLLECVLAMVILPLAVTAITYAVVAGQQQSGEALRRARAARLAEAMMEEILSRPYADPQGSSALGPEAGESTRLLYDNIDDFHGLTEAAGSLKDATLANCPSVLQKFGRSVSCSLGSVTAGGLGAISGIHITVTVTENGSPVVTLTRFKANPS